MASVGTTGCAVSSSTMVPTPVPSAMVALCGLLSTTLNCSLPSTSVSGAMAMVMVLLVSPAAKVTVPLHAGEVRAARRARHGVVVHRHRPGRRRRQRHQEGRVRAARSATRHVAVEVELDRRQVRHLVLVNRAPVVGQDAAGVARVGVPRPEGPAHALVAGRDVGRAVVVEVARQVGGDRLQPRRVLGVGEVGAELADVHRRDPLLVDVAPHLVELGRQVGREVAALEPRLGPDRVGIVVRRVDQLVVEVEVDRPVAHAHQVAAPPVGLALIGGDALDEDQPVGIDRADGVAGALGRRRPVGRPAAAPGAGVRLVVQVGADHRRVVGVARRPASASRRSIATRGAGRRTTGRWARRRDPNRCDDDRG